MTTISAFIPLPVSLSLAHSLIHTLCQTGHSSRRRDTQANGNSVLHFTESPQNIVLADNALHADEGSLHIPG